MSITKVQRVQGDGNWTVALIGVPLAVSAIELRTAVDQMVAALRDYALDWNGFLSTSPNHQGNRDLVQMVDACNDGQLRAWLMGMKP